MIICVTGHRPDKLYGYDLTDPRWQDLKNIQRKTYRKGMYKCDQWYGIRS